MSKADFFSKHKSKFFPINIEGLESAKIRSLSASQKANLLEAWWTGKNEKVIPSKYEKRLARWVQVCIVDDSGSEIFGESDIDDLMEIPAAELERISMACIHFNGYWEDPAETTEKNFESPDGSGTSSD